MVGDNKGMSLFTVLGIPSSSSYLSKLDMLYSCTCNTLVIMNVIKLACEKHSIVLWVERKSLAQIKSFWRKSYLGKCMCRLYLESHCSLVTFMCMII